MLVIFTVNVRTAIVTEERCKLLLQVAQIPFAYSQIRITLAGCDVTRVKKTENQEFSPLYASATGWDFVNLYNT